MAQNAFTNFLAVAEVLQDEDLYETRLENTVEGKILYVGKSITPSADTSQRIWYIKMLHYDANGFIDHIQLPNDGPSFTYSWDDRATYF